MLVIAQRYLAIANGGPVTDGPLQKTRRIIREVVCYVWLSFFDAIDIDDVDVSAFACSEGAAVR